MNGARDSVPQQPLTNLPPPEVGGYGTRARPVPLELRISFGFRASDFGFR